MEARREGRGAEYEWERGERLFSPIGMQLEHRQIDQAFREYASLAILNARTMLYLRIR